MLSDPFNSLGGFSVGIPATQVIDSNGNIVSNFLNLTGNVAAGTIYSDNYRYANGQPFTLRAAGTNTQLQFNNGGAFGGIPNVTWNGNTLSLGNISALNIGGGENGYLLQTDGTGNLSWTAGAGGGNSPAGGSNTQVQFNDAGILNGAAGFTFIPSSGDLRIPGNILPTGNIIPAGNNLSSLGSNTNRFSNLWLSGNTITLGSSSGFDSTISTSAGGNLVLTSGGGGILSVTGNANVSTLQNGNTSIDLTTNGNINFKVAGVSNIVSISNTSLIVQSNVNFANSTSISLGPIGNIKIAGGSNGYVLSTNGSGNLSWNSLPNVVLPGGSNNQVQFNSNGTFGGSSSLTYNDLSKEFQIQGNLIANSVQLGAGPYKWSTSYVYFATTISTERQNIYSTPADNLYGVDFEIIATDPVSVNRQFCKISALYYSGVVQFNEYAGLFVNNSVGNFEVIYESVGISNTPSLVLKVTPNTSNTITYKMLITVYAV